MPPKNFEWPYDPWSGDTDDWWRPMSYTVQDLRDLETAVFGVDLVYHTRTKTWFWGIWHETDNSCFIAQGTKATRDAAKAAALQLLNSGVLQARLKRKALGALDW